MAGDWIKMRPSLLTSPKVNGIARFLEGCKETTEGLSTGFSGRMSEIVTRNVMRNVTVGALLVIWGAANEHTSDGVFRNADLSDIDDMVGIPFFGEAMESVGWAIYNEESCSVTLPNFAEYNTTGGERSATAKTNAQRQKEYRERKSKSDSLQKPLPKNNVTDNVTSNRREEKRREEVNLPSANAEGVGSKPPPCPHQEIIALYHEALPACTAVREWTPARQALLRSRWAENEKRQTLDWWRRFFGYVAESEFLTGRGSCGPDRDPFVADLEWLVRPKNFVKVIEGKYHKGAV